MKKISQNVHKALMAGTDLSPTQMVELAEVKEGLCSLGRRTTEAALALGGYLVRAKVVLPEKTFGKWVKEVCGFTPKTARNYIGVAERLAPFRDRLVAAGVVPTVMFAFVGAEDDAIDKVLAAMEAGEHLTVQQVKSLLGISPRPKPAANNTLDIGGLVGLRRAAEQKIELDMKSFDVFVKRILSKVETAMKPLEKGKRVVISTLVDSIEVDSRHASDLVNAVIAPLTVNTTDPRRTLYSAHVEAGTSWAKVQKVLSTMGSATSWPAKAEFHAWLIDDVLPVLRFVVHSEPLGATESDEKHQLPSAPDAAVATPPSGEKAMILQEGSTGSGHDKATVEPSAPLRWKKDLVEHPDATTGTHVASSSHGKISTEEPPLPDIPVASSAHGETTTVVVEGAING